MSESNLPSQSQESVIVFYCKDCQAIIQAQKIGKKYLFRCNQCQGENVAFGTEKSIRNFFHLGQVTKS